MSEKSCGVHPSVFAVLVVQVHPLPVLYNSQQLVAEVLRLDFAGSLQLELSVSSDQHKASADIPDPAAPDVKLSSLLHHLLHTTDFNPLLVLLVQRLPTYVTAVF